MKIYLLILSLLFCFNIYAEQAGFIVAFSGDVKIFRAQNKEDIPAGSIKTRWNGKDYNSFVPKLYAKVYQDDIVVTGSASKAKIVMSGSNTLMVGPFTNFLIKDAKENKNGESSNSFKLMYGKIRSVVKAKMGEKGKYEITTPTSVIGVRGTDFYTIYSPQNNTTTVSTLDGVVSVSNLTGKIKKEVLVEAGYSSHVIDIEQVKLDGVKETTKLAVIDTKGLPTIPQKVQNVELEDIKAVSTIPVDLNNIKIESEENKKEAIKTENKILDLIKSKSSSTDESLKNDPLNINLDKLINKIKKDETLRQKEEGALDNIGEWLRNY